MLHVAKMIFLWNIFLSNYFNPYSAMKLANIFLVQSALIYSALFVPIQVIMYQALMSVTLPYYRQFLQNSRVTVNFKALKWVLLLSTENWRKLSHKYHQILLLNKSPDYSEQL